MTWVSSFSPLAFTHTASTACKNRRCLIEDKQHKHRQWQLKSFVFKGLLLRFSWGCSLVKAEKWHSTRERNSKGENPLTLHAYLHLGKKAKWNPVRPWTESLLYGTREQTGQRLRIIWQRKGLGFRKLTHTLTFPDGTLLRGMRTFVLEVKWWAAGRSLAHRGQKAGRSPWWHAWSAGRAWTHQFP